VNSPSSIIFPYVSSPIPGIVSTGLKAMSAAIKKIKAVSNNLTHLKLLEIQEKAEPKSSRWEEIIIIRAEQAI
jgi:hypothetical protein